jgi:hypothetical protein
MTRTDIGPSEIEGYDVVVVRTGDETVVVRAYVPTESAVRWACEQMEMHHRVLDAAAERRKAAAQ